MRMKRKRRKSKERMERMEFRREITKFLNDDQYLKFVYILLLLKWWEKLIYLVTLKTLRRRRALRTERPNCPASGLGSKRLVNNNCLSVILTILAIRIYCLDINCI